MLKGGSSLLSGKKFNAPAQAGQKNFIIFTLSKPSWIYCKKNGLMSSIEHRR